ncbi:MAG: ribonuclease D [Coriobacteriaceae bacterium]
MEYIASQENLEAFVRRAASSSVLAIDTEFLREKTYYANLCLIQLATDAEVAVVDPFAIEDMKVLAPLLTDSSIVKLFHAGGQDLEILYRELGVLPAPLFDTQVAATLLGHTQQIGYGPLVHSLCGVNLKKSDSFTDWSRRPLSTSQLEYAADDVIYLPKMYRIMVEKLEAKGRLHWLDNDFAAMSDPAHYESDPFERYKRLKRVGQLTRRQLSAAREVACWREVTAQERDMPRKWVLTDEQIVEACRRESRTIDDLFLIRGVREKLNTRDARAWPPCSSGVSMPRPIRGPSWTSRRRASATSMPSSISWRRSCGCAPRRTTSPCRRWPPGRSSPASPGATPPMSMCCAAGAAPWWGTSCWSFSPADSPCPSAPKDSW